MRKSRFSIEQIFQILAESYLPSNSVPSACRKYNIPPSLFYKWKNKYKNLSKNKANKIKVLEYENAMVKKLIAEKEMKNTIVHEIIKKIITTRKKLWKF